MPMRFECIIGLDLFPALGLTVTGLQLKSPSPSSQDVPPACDADDDNRPPADKGVALDTDGSVCDLPCPSVVEVEHVPLARKWAAEFASPHLVKRPLLKAICAEVEDGHRSQGSCCAVTAMLFLTPS